MKQPHFEKQQATLAHVALNRLKVGKGGKPGVTLSLVVNTSNDALDMLQPELKKALFKKPGKERQMELGAGPDALTELKLPGIEPLKIEGKWEHYEMILDGQLEGTESLPFVDASIKDWTITAIEGGSVSLAFKVSCAIELDEIPNLVDFWMNEGVHLTLTPPKDQPES